MAISRDGVSRRVTYRDVGLSGPGFSNNYLAPFSRGDSSAARWVVDRLNRTWPDSVTELRLETVRYRLVDPGLAIDTLPVLVYRAAQSDAR
jgi:hypothetical protein